MAGPKVINIIIRHSWHYKKSVIKSKKQNLTPLGFKDDLE